MLECIIKYENSVRSNDVEIDVFIMAGLLVRLTHARNDHRDPVNHLLRGNDVAHRRHKQPISKQNFETNSQNKI